MKNRKYTPRTLEKLFIFRKILYLSPGKMLEIANFDEKSRKSNAENPNGIPRTRQSRIKNEPDPGKSSKIDEKLKIPSNFSSRKVWSEAEGFSCSETRGVCVRVRYLAHASVVQTRRIIARTLARARLGSLL